MEHQGKPSYVNRLVLPKYLPITIHDQASSNETYENEKRCLVGSVCKRSLELVFLMVGPAFGCSACNEEEDGFASLSFPSTILRYSLKNRKPI